MICWKKLGQIFCRLHQQLYIWKIQLKKIRINVKSKHLHFRICSELEQRFRITKYLEAAASIFLFLEYFFLEYFGKFELSGWNVKISPSKETFNPLYPRQNHRIALSLHFQKNDRGFLVSGRCAEKSLHFYQCSSRQVRLFLEQKRLQQWGLPITQQPDGICEQCVAFLHSHGWISQKILSYHLLIIFKDYCYTLVKTITSY